MIHQDPAWREKHGFDSIAKLTWRKPQIKYRPDLGYVKRPYKMGKVLRVIR
jgi:hypothetical protein